MVSAAEGWMGSGADPVPAANAIGQLLRAVGSGDEEKILKKIGKVVETTAVMSGTPIMPIKRGKKAINAMLEGRAWRRSFGSSGV